MNNLVTIRNTCINMSAKYEYECLALGDADAIIIRHYIMENGVEKPYVIVIDAGKVGDGKKVAKHLLNFFGSKHIDLAICTHPDSDHKDGFFDLLDDKDVIIDDFWLTDPADFLTVDDIKYYKCKESAERAVREIWNKSTDSSRNLIDGVLCKCKKVYSVNAGSSHSFLPITVLAPNQNFYSEIVKEIVAKKGVKAYDKSDTTLYDENAAVDEKQAKSVIDECTDDSPTNASSIILLYEPEPGKKFLFAGDATQESLQMVIDTYELCNIDFLKVPHHGSKHNLTTPIIDKLSPRKSFITASGSSKHPSSAVVYWLSKYGDVYSTQSCEYNLHCSKSLPDRKNIKSIKPIKRKMQYAFTTINTRPKRETL